MAPAAANVNLQWQFGVGHPSVCCLASGVCWPELWVFAHSLILDKLFLCSQSADLTCLHSLISPVVDSVPRCPGLFQGCLAFALPLLPALLPRLCRSVSLESAGGGFYSPLFPLCQQCMFSHSRCSVRFWLLLLF